MLKMVRYRDEKGTKEQGKTYGTSITLRCVVGNIWAHKHQQRIKNIAISV